MRGPEPRWAYGLAEVLFQMLLHNGDLPLLAVRSVCETFDRQRRPSLAGYVGELDLIDPSGLFTELDIIFLTGSEIWIGEATCKPRLGTAKVEKARLRRLHQVADVLGARRILLVNGGAWAAKTRQTAQDMLGNNWTSVSFIENVPLARDDR